MAETQDDSRRAQILRAAESLFQHYGFNKTTVADIAREADVGVGTVYLEFPSKQAIAAALSDERHDHILTAMRDAAGSGDDFAARLRAMFDARFAQLARVAGSGQHGMDLLQSRCSATAEVCQRSRDRQEQLVAEFLSAAHDAGAFDVAQPRVVARVLLQVYDSFGETALCGQGRSRVRREIALTHTLLIHGLARRSDK